MNNLMQCMEIMQSKRVEFGTDGTIALYDEEGRIVKRYKVVYDTQ